MDYKAIYDGLIEKAKTRENLKGYVEKHHIVPRCLGGFNDPENLVFLTAREHFVAHCLLYKFCEGSDKYKMGCALHWMCYSSTGPNRGLTDRQFEIARKCNSEENKNKTFTEEHRRKMSEGRIHIKGENHPRYGMKHTEKTKQRLSEQKKGENHPSYGKKRGDETRQKMRQNHRNQKGEKNHNYGKRLCEETRQKMREAKRGKQEQVTCPHCDKVGGLSAMKKWHFDNCRCKK